MRGRKAKALRKIAQEATVGRPAVAYGQNKRTGEIRVMPDTTRGVYKIIKKAYKQGKRNAKRSSLSQ